MDALVSRVLRKLPEGEAEIAEFQGLYGAFHVSEVLLQKIWWRRQFAVGNAQTLDGQPVRIIRPGQWNRLAGPDFEGASLVIGGREVSGAIEVHFRAEAWRQHGHDKDPAYDGVVLHVVLFPPEPSVPPTTTRSGREVPILVMVDLLWHDLEEYAEDEAVAALSGRDIGPLVEKLLALEPAEREALLVEAETRRWNAKRHFAGVRIARLGWEDACHHTALEILGYRHNRVAMLRVAVAHPWVRWIARPPAVDELLVCASETWMSRGVRPANLPRLRLAQYSAWLAGNPGWPQRLRDWRPVAPAAQPASVGGVRQARKGVNLPQLRRELEVILGDGVVGGTRLDTLIVNLALPFLGAAGFEEEAMRLWKLWPPGDVPDGVREALRQVPGNQGRDPPSNGRTQALLGLQLDALARDSVPLACGSDGA